MGMLRRLPPVDIDEQGDVQLKQVIEQELENGNITLSGRRAVWVHLRNIGILASG